MNITLNGEQREFPDGLTVRGLLEHLNIRHQRVAVELNEAIVKKEHYEETPVKDGDALEVVSFMGGGQEVRSVEYGMKNKCRMRISDWENR